MRGADCPQSCMRGSDAATRCVEQPAGRCAAGALAFRQPGSSAPRTLPAEYNGFTRLLTTQDVLVERNQPVFVQLIICGEPAHLGRCAGALRRAQALAMHAPAVIVHISHALPASAPIRAHSCARPRGQQRRQRGVHQGGQLDVYAGPLQCERHHGGVQAAGAAVAVVRPASAHQGASPLWGLDHGLPILLPTRLCQGGLSHR